MTTESVAPEVLHVWAIYLRASEEARRRGDRRTGTDHVLLADTKCALQRIAIFSTPSAATSLQK